VGGRHERVGGDGDALGAGIGFAGGAEQDGDRVAGGGESLLLGGSGMLMIRIARLPATNSAGSSSWRSTTQNTVL
jgi:hypothetical protein